MPSPSSCFRCSKPLALVSPSGLCPTCALSADTANPTLRPSPLPERDLPTATDHPATPTGTAAPGHDTAGARTAAHPLPHAPAGYDLLERLGGGGMGDVYLARKHASERLVAMKFLRYPGSPDAVDRFVIELRALALIDHPNVVRLYDDDFLRADPFFTMEYMPHGSLARGGGGPLPPAEAVKLVRAVAGALSAAHAERIIHRDLKPSNILLAADGTPKVADFGLAKRLDDDLSLTPASGALGTVQYMPPEQVTSRNGEIGPWSDVFGLGATLYHLLCGKPPFTGGTSQDIIMKVVLESPPRLRDVPAALEGIVFKCLEKDPKDRYQSMAELIADLDRFTAGQKPKAPALTRWRRARRWAMRNRRAFAAALAVLVAVTGAAVLGGAFWPKPKPADPVEEMQRELAAGRSVTLIGKTGLPRWHRWAFGTTGLEEAPAAGNACSFETIESSMLEVLSDPGRDSYEVKADLRLLRLRLPGGGNAAPPLTNLAGLYFADCTPDGASHAFLAVAYNDFLDPLVQQAGIEKAIVQLRTVCLIPNGVAGPSEPTGGVAPPIHFAPAANLPGEWRRMRVEVTPERVRVFWATDPDKTPDDKMELLADLPAADIDYLFQTQRERLDGARPGLSNGLPNWHPRMPIGIWCRGGAVAVKNVIVTPLPRK